MNIKEFIETSGVLEEYVMSTLSQQEQQGVECMAQTYPEIQVELQKLQKSLEKYVFLHERNPPPMLKEQLFARMTFDDPIEETEKATEDFDPVMDISERETSETLAAPQGKQVFPTWGIVSVAASVLLLVTAGWLFTQNNSLKDSNNALVDRVEVIEGNNLKNTSLLTAYSNPENKIITLNGLDKSKESSVTVFWNQENNQVALRVNNLPLPASDEQYQLWTIVDGSPVDMGVIDNNFQEKLLAMKAVKGSPVAFAITLEKAGGSPTPTLEEMYVMGEV
jgi:anti-sigma-K factor RskA